ncbi:hypothetical protein AB1Y20_006201 [Prymnesium parvum]|uniref:Uncharacterized protein n=1 Tax=Prymnesium parvum TaxID=97485 RepID=A0AB34J444_PRYPA
MEGAEVTLLGARAEAGGGVVYQTVRLRRAGGGNASDRGGADEERRPAPGTGAEAFVAATTPLVLLVLGVIGLAFQALNVRRPPPGAMQMVDGEAVAMPHSLPRLQSSA